MRNYRMLTGEIDQAPLQDVRLTRLIYAASQDAKAPFVFQWGPFTQAFSLFLNLSLHRGVRDDRDLAVRQLFRELEFRQALTHAIDGEAIAEGVFGSPDVKAYDGGYPSGSVYYQEDKVVKYPYDPAEAERLLAGLGFTDTDGDGFLNWPEDSLLSGENLVVELNTQSTNPDHIALCEAAQPYLQAAGIDLRLRILGEPLLYDKEDTQEFDIIVEPTYTAAPDVRPEAAGPISLATPWWHKAGPDGQRDLLPFEERIGELLESTFTMSDAAERAEAFEEILALATENVYTVPIVEVAYSMTFAKRHRNYPSDLPVYLYDWFHENLPIEMKWCPEELQLSTESYLQYIATPETYEAQAWYQITGE